MIDRGTWRQADHVFGELQQATIEKMKEMIESPDFYDTIMWIHDYPEKAKRFFPDDFIALAVATHEAACLGAKIDEMTTEEEKPDDNDPF
jgi:hypothetical protein